MDTTIFIPLIDALYNIVGAVDAKWAAMFGIVLLLLRAGVIRFPISLPSLKAKNPAKPADPIPDQPAPPAPPAQPADPADALRDLINKMVERFRDRLSRRTASLLEKELPLADEVKDEPVKHSE